jgi:hypothetical protein
MRPALPVRVRGGGRGTEPGVAGGDGLGPGPGEVDVQGAASRGPDDEPGDGQDAQPQPRRLVDRPVRGQCEAGTPGQQVRGGRADRQPDPVLVGVVEGQVAQPGVLRAGVFLTSFDHISVPDTDP